ncbi:chemotaxis response regulator protein-glutamate methylesterase [Sporolactobacillus sp. THM7-4]|nr:chemotaxis response regulator protein-glutamate methylesterase [Sporolactobacillus sp. THM7-4]
MEQIKVLVVDDSAFMRQTLKGMIEEDPALKVIATARNGKDALDKLFRCKPDVVTLDIVMSGDKNGLEVLNDIMALKPTPTIMVSGASDENARYVIEAISGGAFDFISKPTGRPGDVAQIEDTLQKKIRQAAGWKPKTYIPPCKALRKKKREASPAFQSGVKNLAVSADPSLVFIGTSTGGPKALQTVIPSLGAGLPAPVVVVQHMPAAFTKSLADRLDRLSVLHVTEAKDGDVLEKGHVYIAPGGFHLLIKEEREKLVARLSDTEPVHGVKPSVDVTLQSFLEIEHCSFIVAILTGMGRDGADGLAELKRKKKNVFTIAESEETSVVFGMPKAAIETNQVDEVCLLHHVASAICNQFGARGAD